MSDPNYVFLIGAPKAGTSSISAAFKASDHVAVSRIKESRYFTDFAQRRWHGPKSANFLKNAVADWDTYDALFAAAPWRMDASTDYFACPGSAESLAEFAAGKTVKVVAILRDPVARIVSEFQHTLRDDYQTGTLKQSLDAEAERHAQNWLPLFWHVARSRYAEQIQRYRALFGDNFLVLDFHKLKEGRGGVGAIADFIGVPVPDITSIPHANKSHVPRSRVLSTVMQSKGLRTVARRILPSSVRGSIASGVMRANQTTYTATDEELAMIRASLADDIAWCVADPDVPTDRWTLALK